MIVDTGLHYVGFTRDQALEYSSKYAWNDTDFGRKEVNEKVTMESFRGIGRFALCAMRYVKCVTQNSLCILLRNANRVIRKRNAQRLIYIELLGVERCKWW